MSTAKPHRRLSLTQPTAAAGSETVELDAPREDAGALEFRLAEWEERIARIEESIRRLSTREPSRPLSSVQTQQDTPFQIADAHGRTLLEVTADEHGPSLRLFNAAGKPVAVLSGQANGGGIGVCNPEGEFVATVFAHADGGAIGVRNAGGAPAATLFAHPEGGALEMFGRGGHGAAVLGASETGGRLDINDHRGDGVIRVGVRETGRGVAVYDASGSPAAILAADGVRYADESEHRPLPGPDVTSGLPGAPLDDRSAFGRALPRPFRHPQEAQSRAPGRPTNGSRH